MNYHETTINQPYLEILKCCDDHGSVKKLWCQGQLPKKRIKTVAIVGARHSTQYGENIAYRAAYELAKRGVIIVSGMAYGIDACAHRGCL